MKIEGEGGSSTTVPLTLQLLKLTMPLHDSSGSFPSGESPTKRLTGGTVFFWNGLAA